MLTLFLAMGLIERRGETYGVTALAREHLTDASPFSLTPYYASFKDRPICRDFVRDPSQRASPQLGGRGAGRMARGDEEAGIRQAVHRGDGLPRCLSRSRLSRAPSTVRTRHRLLDIAGGSGIYACCIVEEHPQLRATVLERPPVDEVARRAIASRGFSDRVSVHAARYARRPAAGRASTRISFRTSSTTGTCRSSGSCLRLPPPRCRRRPARGARRAPQRRRRPARSRSPHSRAC